MRIPVFFFFALAACKGGGTLPTETGDRNDADGDGFNLANDCDDSDPEVNPDAPDEVGDGVDNNCDGEDGVDADGDGFASEESGGEDCQDDDIAINPDATEIGWNGVDEDCRGGDRHDYTTIGAGTAVSCGVRTTGELTCWGDDSFGQLQVPTATDWTAVTGGDQWVCGIAAGEILCWGDDEHGVVSGVPAIADFVGSEWEQLRAGRDHACAITNLGDATCWGRDDFDQVTGVNLLQGFEIEHVAPGKDHTCVVLAQGRFAQCVGSGSFDQTTPRPPQGQFLGMASGDNHTCAIDLDRRMTCWGDAVEGQIAPVDAIGPYTDLAAFGNSNCGVVSNTDISCWGDGAFEQIFPPDQTAVQVEMGPTHGCARNGIGLVFCWGDNSLGQTDTP